MGHRSGSQLVDPGMVVVVGVVLGMVALGLGVLVQRMQRKKVG